MVKKTRDKILDAALSLMAERGFSHVSVKEIALCAGVSEMTVFRHFETKMGILQALIQTYSYVPYFEHFFSSELTGNLEKDLKQIANSYLAFMEKNKSIFLIAIQERGTLPELKDLISDENTKQLQNLLANYFKVQIEKGKMKDVDTEGQAIGFLTTLFGFFVSVTILENHFLQNQQESFINNLIESFVNGVSA